MMARAYSSSDAGSELLNISGFSSFWYPRRPARPRVVACDGHRQRLRLVLLQLQLGLRWHHRIVSVQANRAPSAAPVSVTFCLLMSVTLRTARWLFTSTPGTPGGSYSFWMCSVRAFFAVRARCRASSIPLVSFRFAGLAVC